MYFFLAPFEPSLYTIQTSELKIYEKEHFVLKLAGYHIKGTWDTISYKLYQQKCSVTRRNVKKSLIKFLVIIIWKLRNYDGLALRQRFYFAVGKTDANSFNTLNLTLIIAEIIAETNFSTWNLKLIIAELNQIFFHQTYLNTCAPTESYKKEKIRRSIIQFNFIKTKYKTRTLFYCNVCLSVYKTFEAVVRYCERLIVFR